MLMCSDALHSQPLLIGSGFCNWKHALERLSSHEQSKENTDAFTAFHGRLKMAGTVDEQMEQYWNSVLEHAVSVIKFTAERVLAFKVDNELIGSPGHKTIFSLLSSSFIITSF